MAIDTNTRVSFRRLLILLTLALPLASCGGGGEDSQPAPVVPAPAPTPQPPAPATVTYLHSFQRLPSDGGQPNGPLLQANDGNFYGTTRAGGPNTCRPVLPIPCGVIFKVTPAGVETVLYAFGTSANDGYTPLGSLIQGQDGALYGTTSNGGIYGGGGTIFRITLGGAYSVLHSFGATPTDGITPTSGLIQARDGDFYGVTVSGGTNHCANIPQAGGNCGTVFKMASNGAVTILYSFGTSFSDGVTPNGPLLQASDGNFYGTTGNGGANNYGTVFKITSAGIETVMRSLGAGFNPGFLPTDAYAPQGALVQGSDGALFGTSVSGGGGSCGNTFSCGTVFRITLAGDYSILYAFATSSTKSGHGPSPYLIQGRDGNFYGTTYSGGDTLGTPDGTVFRLTPSGIHTTLYSFGPLNDAPSHPETGVIQGSDGALYGTTFYSRQFDGSGTVFRLSLQ